MKISKVIEEKLLEPRLAVADNAFSELKYNFDSKLRACVFLWALNTVLVANEAGILVQKFLFTPGSSKN